MPITNGLNSKIYDSYFDKQNTQSTTILVTICIILLVQFIITILLLFKGYKKYRQYSIKKKSQSRNAQNNQHKKQTNQALANNKNQILTNKLIFSSHNRFFLIFLFLLYFIIVITSAIMLLVSILSVLQAVDYNYKESEKILQFKIQQFQSGNQKWIGLQKIVPNLTQLNLVLNTRLQVSINVIRGLLLNGTALSQAQRTFAIGFPNNTLTQVIKDANIPSNLTVNPIINTTNIQSFITAKLQMWLYRNTSYSNAMKFPICQPGLKFNIQHPILQNQLIQINYMDSICTKLTKQAQDLINNGKKADQLLIELQNILAIKSSIQTNLSSLNETYSPISIRSNEYSLQLNSILINNININIKNISLSNFGLYLIFNMICLFFMLFTYWKYLCNFCKCEFHCECDCDCDCDDQQEQESFIQANNANKRYKNLSKKSKDISVNYSRFFLIILILINILIGVSSYYYSMASLSAKDFCSKFKDGKKNFSVIQNIGLKKAQIQLLRPLQKCISGQNQYFMQNTAVKTAQISLLRLQNISNTFNSSVPKNIYSADSLQLIQVLKQYLSHLQKIPIKSTSFDLIGALKQLNQYSNGSHSKSKQLQQCSSSVIQDEYVYNSIDCHNKLLNLGVEQSTIQPRCIIIPTYNGTSGANTTKLNSAQHTFVLNSSCTSIEEMFNPLNINCFLSKRLNLLKAGNCLNTALQLGKRLQNLVKFSILATSYTDIYIQNVRNFFGAYAGLSTNLTQFFAGRNNMPQILADFGILSNNLLKKTKCQPIKNNIQQIYNSYCPIQNNMSMLFYDAFQWTLIAFILIFVQTIVFYFTDIIFRINKINKSSQQSREINTLDDNKKNSQKIIKNNQIQLSRQTLIRDHINNQFDYHDEIYNQKQNQFKQNQNIQPYFDSAKKINEQMQQTGFDKNRTFSNFENRLINNKFQQNNQSQGQSQINSKKLLKIELDQEQQQEQPQQNKFIIKIQAKNISQKKQLKKSKTHKHIKKRLSYKLSDQINNNSYVYPIIPEPYRLQQQIQTNKMAPQRSISPTLSQTSNKTNKKPKNYLLINIKDDLKIQQSVQKLKLYEKRLQQQLKQNKTSR